MPPFQCLITIVNYALPSCCKTYICELCNAMFLQRHYICELSNAMLFSQSSCMWIISCYHFFCITCSICRQRLYIQLLFLCISHLKRWWKYLEWKKVFRADNATYWSRHLAGYRELLGGGFRDWWPVLFPPWGLCSNLAGLYYPCHACCLALLSFYIIYGLPSAYLLTI